MHATEISSTHLLDERFASDRNGFGPMIVSRRRVVPKCRFHPLAMSELKCVDIAETTERTEYGQIDEAIPLRRILDLACTERI